MKKYEGNEITAASGAGISVRKLISRLANSLAPSAARNRVYILNGVSAQFRIPEEQVRVISVIKELLTAIACNGRNTCISVTAEKYTDIIILNFEDQNNYNGYALSFSLMAIGEHARFAGGDISIEGARNKIATVSFSFPGTAFLQNQLYSH